MLAALRGFVATWSGKLALVAIASGVLYVPLFGLSDQFDRDGLLSNIALLEALVYNLFYYFAPLAAVFFLICRGWFAVAAWLATWGILYASHFAMLYVSNDEFILNSRAHREIAEIYRRDFARVGEERATTRVIPLQRKLPPPHDDCVFWIVVDPNHTSGVDGETGGWHHPGVTNILPNTIPPYFAIVDVRRIDTDAYSVLGCPFDPSGLNLG